MTVSTMLEFDSMPGMYDELTRSPASSPSLDQDVKARVHELLLLMYRPNPAEEQRRDRRYPYPHLVRMTPVADDGITPSGSTVMVAGSTLSEGGFGFYHPQPLAHRRMIASFHTGDNRWVGLLVDLRWCRFVGQGWYESGEDSCDQPARFSRKGTPPIRHSRPLPVVASADKKVVMPPPLEILFEDEHCLALNKPAGLSTQAPRGIDSLEMRVRAILQDRATNWPGTGENTRVYLGLPHRLDRPVSGVLVLAKTKKGARKISKQFERRRVRKIYWAAVEGAVEPNEGTWVDWLRKVPGESRAEVVPADHPDAQRAVLHVRTLGQTQHGSWLEIELETGRMHQIRVQLAARGWPVLGDVQYGSQLPFGPQHDDSRTRAIALHARELSFVQPVTQTQLTITAPVGDAWRDLGIVDRV